jgi:predicted RNA-binding protein (virulence factor B family)
MIHLGKYNTLHVLRESPAGLILVDSAEDGDIEEVLLPRRYMPEAAEAGDEMELFVYLDNEGQSIATTQKPLATVDQFAFLELKERNEFGAFFDWGIDKDIFVPYSEQVGEPEPGRKYLVFIFIDDRSGRIAATQKWNQVTGNDPEEYAEEGLQEGAKVNLLIAQETETGYKAIINHKFQGLLYRNEVFEPLNPGDERQGFIKKMRDDGKIDLTLQQQGYSLITDTRQMLLEKLKAANGILALGDKSAPDDIYNTLHMSKKVFKKTVGGLYKDRLISVADFEIRLLQTKES